MQRRWKAKALTLLQILPTDRITKPVPVEQMFLILCEISDSSNFFLPYSVYRTSQKYLKNDHLKYIIPFQLALFLICVTMWTLVIIGNSSNLGVVLSLVPRFKEILNLKGKHTWKEGRNVIKTKEVWPHQRRMWLTWFLKIEWMGYCISKFLPQIFCVYCAGHLVFSHPSDIISGINISYINLMQ